MVDQVEKRIKETDNHFEAGGAKYIIHSSVTAELYRDMDELLVRGRFGKGYAQLHNAYVKWVELKNAQKPFDADIHLRNIFEGVARGVNKQHDPLILICTLFIWPEGTTSADKMGWSEEAANEKIRAWSEEGYPVEDFTKLGVCYARRYASDFITDSQDTSEEPQK